ncbi:MAG: methyltransferase domain-containing protein [Patescibacteria group bacterium]
MWQFWKKQSVVHDPKDVSHIGEYLEEYYDFLTEENLEIGLFLRDAVAGVKGRFPVIKVLDAGCGPTMLYWAAFMDAADEYHGLDAREDHVDYVKSQSKESLPPRLLDLCEEMALRQAASTSAHAYYAALCSKLRTMTVHDMNFAWPYEEGTFPVIMSAFGLECIESMDKLVDGIREVYRLLPKNGRFIFVTIAETDYWKIGDTTLRCLDVNAKVLEEAARKAGFKNIHVETRAATTALERRQGYETMVFGYADKL